MKWSRPIVTSGETMIIAARRRAITLFEVVIASALFLLLMLAVYRLFFAEVRNIKTALEHIGVNESARRFFANMGNDIRNANWVEFPTQTNRQTVSVLMPVNDGKLCVLRRQVFDFSIKPPDTRFIREEIIEYFLKKAEDGTSDLYRKVKSDFQNASNKQYEKKICDGIREISMFTTNRKPVNITSFSALVPFKSLLSYEPYELDGTGPYLVHVVASFVRKGDSRDAAERVAHKVRTCFCVRGKLNGVHP
ncbi:MAG: hypothetical protein EOM80_17840 [Erysipelotrichia bacterium]|nr:hypothetical protein [Erysipelotrichia bacterium]